MTVAMYRAGSRLPQCCSSPRSPRSPKCVRSAGHRSTVKANNKAVKVLKLDEYPGWNRVTSTAISPDGRWMTYAYEPNEGDATLYVKQLDADKVYTTSIGTAPAGGGVAAGAAGAGAVARSSPMTRSGSHTT